MPAMARIEQVRAGIHGDPVGSQRERGQHAAEDRPPRSGRTCLHRDPSMIEAVQEDYHRSVAAGVLVLDAARADIHELHQLTPLPGLDRSL